MKILITGGAGFIGLNLAQKLVKKKQDVYLIDNFITSDKNNLSAFRKKYRINFFKHDICDPLPGKIKRIKFSQIYHLACPTGVPNIQKLSREMLFTSSTGTGNILELARQNKASYLFTSSSEIYGDPLVFPQKESYTGNVDPTGLRSPYEEGKRFAESLTAVYQRKYGVKVSIVRLFNTYGPWMNLSDTRVIPKMLGSALTSKPLTIEGTGTQRRTFCFVDDVVDGLVKIMGNNNSELVYNLGSDKEISILDLAQIILHLTESKSRLKFIKRPQHDHQRRLPDLTKARKAGFNNKTTLEKGLKTTISWLRKIKHLS